MASIFDNKFCIPLDFEILESSLPLYQYGSGSCLTYELTFADYSKNVIKASNPDASYTISNISLEFDTVTNASLASQIRTEYLKSSTLYDRILKASDASNETVSSIFDNKFCIPLDFEILESSLPLYQYGLGSRLTYELTFADYSNVIKASNPDASYTISNISLEFDRVTNSSLASQIRTEYMKSSTLYDRILRDCIIPLNNSSTRFSVDIDSLSKSLKGVLLIFTKERSATKFNRDTEEFFNP